MAMRVEKRNERVNEVPSRPNSKDTAARAAKLRDEFVREVTSKHTERKATPSSVPEVTSTTDMVRVKVYNIGLHHNFRSLVSVLV